MLFSDPEKTTTKVFIYTGGTEDRERAAEMAQVYAAKNRHTHVQLIHAEDVIMCESIEPVEFMSVLKDASLAKQVKEQQEAEHRLLLREQGKVLCYFCFQGLTNKFTCENCGENAFFEGMGEEDKAKFCTAEGCGVYMCKKHPEKSTA